jgi:DNA-binding GntR family transcriptional regulator
MSQARLSGRANRADLRRGSTLLLPIQGVRLSDEVYERLLGKPDVDFHLAIAEATHNTVMAHIVNSLHGMFLAVLRVRFVVRNPARTQLLVTQHETILEAIRRRDRVGATKAMVAHLEFIGEEIKWFSGRICRSSISPSSLRLRDSTL